MVEPSSLIILIILVGLSAFFSASEIILFSLPHYIINQIERNSKLGTYIKKFRERQDFFLVTILFYNNLVNIAASVISGVLITQYLGDEGVGVATTLMTFVILTFGEIFPKSLGYKHNRRVAPFIAMIIYSLGIIVYPVTRLYEIILGKILGEKESHNISEKELKMIVDVISKRGVIERQEGNFVKRMLDLDEKTVRRVLVKREDVVMVNDETSVREALEKMIKTGYSRLPVFHRKKDNIIGIIHIKDLVKVKNKRRKVKEFLHDPIIVEANEKLNTVLEIMKSTRTHMAIIKEKNKFKGIVTLEDIIVEIFGQIRDEISKKNHI